MSGLVQHDEVGACRKLSEYNIIGIIGEGTYGKVYKCVHNSITTVALKRLKVYRDGTGRIPLTSLREIYSLRKSCGHENIVHLYDVVIGNSMDDIYLSLEYCDHDLETLITKFNYPFNESNTKCLMIQLLSGLQYIHQLHIIHRDIKLSNLLYTNTGKLKIADFGLSRTIKPHTNLILTPTVVSLWYRAPELLLGGEIYTSAIDIWSCGCILGEFLLKTPLFAGKNEIQQIQYIFDTLGCPSIHIWPEVTTMKLIQNGTIDLTLARQRNIYNNLSILLPTLSAEGFEFLNRLLAYDPSKRYTASQALSHMYLNISPYPTDYTLMPTFPTTLIPMPSTTTTTTTTTNTTSTAALSAMSSSSSSSLSAPLSIHSLPIPSSTLSSSSSSSTHKNKHLPSKAIHSSRVYKKEKHNDIKYSKHKHSYHDFKSK